MDAIKEMSRGEVWGRLCAKNVIINVLREALVGNKDLTFVRACLKRVKLRAKRRN